MKFFLNISTQSQLDRLIASAVERTQEEMRAEANVRAVEAEQRLKEAFKKEKLKLSRYPTQ